MADDYTILNPGVGGDVMDESLVVYPSSPTNRKRPRVVITGEGIDDIVPAQVTNPGGDEFGLVTRPIVPSYPGTEANTFGDVALVLTSTETTVVTYTVPANKTFYFIGFVVSGNANALFKLYVDGVAVLAGSYGVSELNECVQEAFLPPALVVHPRDIEDTFRRLVEDRDFREKIANDCKTFISSNWSAKKVSERFLLVVNGTFPQDWYFDPLKISYVHGACLEESELISIWNSGTARFGPVFLNIPHRPDLYEKMQNMILNAVAN